MHIRRIFLAFILFLSTKGIAGSAHGGGETNDLNRCMWFQGERTIKYCLHVAPDFGTTERKVETAFLNAVGVWKKYISDLLTIPIMYKPAVIFQRASLCQGEQDLDLYFGVEPEKVKAEKKNYLTPVAFTKKEIYDIAHHWSKGYLWVAKGMSIPIDDERNTPKMGPDWTSFTRLQSILTHELGHLYGNDHISNTIMDDYVPKMVLNSPNESIESTPRMLEIDHGVHLYRDSPRNEVLQGKLDAYMIALPEQDAKTFLKFSGQEAVGHVKTSLQILDEGREPTLSLPRMTIYLVDGVGKKARIDLQLSKQMMPPSHTYTLGIAFRGVRIGTDGTPSKCYGNYLTGGTSLAKAKDAKGNLVNILISRNSGRRGPVAVTYEENLEFFPLFFQANNPLFYDER